MTPQFRDLNPDQQEAIRALRAEIADLNLQQDVEWAKYMKTGDQECYNTVRALESEAEMKGLIAYLPKAGEGKTKRIRDLIGKIKKQDDDIEACEGCDELPGFAEVRLDTLDSINSWREQYGIPLLDRLPKGLTGDASECVIANAFNSIEVITIEGKEWRVSSASIGGGGDYKLNLLPDENGNRYDYDGTFHIRPDNPGAWDNFITMFDEERFYDLIDDHELLQKVNQRAAEGDHVPEQALEEVFQRGLINELNDRVSFSDGVFTVLDYDGDEAQSYKVGTVSVMVDAQFA